MRKTLSFFDDLIRKVVVNTNYFYFTLVDEDISKEKHAEISIY